MYDARLAGRTGAPRILLIRRLARCEMKERLGHELAKWRRRQRLVSWRSSGASPPIHAMHARLLTHFTNYDVIALSALE